GPAPLPKVFQTGTMIVLLTPNKQQLYVYTTSGEWKLYSMQFPSPDSSLDASFYRAMTSLNDREIEQIVERCSPETPHHSARYEIDRVDPATRKFHVRCILGESSESDFELVLSEDGSQLKLAPMTDAGSSG
ncbi:MAG: hypothetical protein KDD44_12180, partial [Bdellovibrionales bacterium]|nr:hypothetical protein [Bdellovibrionales bacterium]